MVALARAAGGAQRVVAHTLQQRGASTRILDKAGLALVGEVQDPDDGPLWRWEVRLSL